MNDTKVIDIKSKNIEKIVAQYIKKNLIVIMPCDTIYGIIGKAPDTFEKLRDLKNRGEKKFIQLISEKNIGDFSIPKYLLKFWPGPLTLIVNRGDGATVGIRCPDNNLLLEIMKIVNCSLFSTSVNFSGESQLNNFADIYSVFNGRVDLIVKDNDFKGYTASTIIDITGDKVKLIREGKIKFNDIDVSNL